MYACQLGISLRELDVVQDKPTLYETLFLKETIVDAKSQYYARAVVELTVRIIEKELKPYGGLATLRICVDLSALVFYGTTKDTVNVEREMSDK